MGSGQSSESFFKRFQEATLAESSRNELWHIYRASTAPDLSKLAEGEYLEAKTKEEKAALSGSASTTTTTGPSPLTKLTRRYEIAKQYTNSPDGTPVVILEVNKQHKSVPSKASDKHKYSLLDVSRSALDFAMMRPHYTLPNVVDVQHFPSSGELCAVVNCPRLDPIVESIHRMSSSEILYGLSCIIRGLLHLHRNGFAHRNLSWRSIYKNPLSPQQHWILMDFQFMFNQRQVFGSASSEHVVALLTEIRAVREAKDLELVAPEDNNVGSVVASELPIGACDMYAFGAMIEELLGSQTHARTTSPAFTQVVSPYGNPECSTVAVLASLKEFAARCKHGNPHKRPTAGEFLILPCIQSSVFVNIMTFCDTMPSKTNEDEKRLFFGMLHLELLKLPYDLVTARLLPRLMSHALWSEPSAEPFLKHLLSPFTPRTKDTECAYLHVPLRPDIQRAFNKRGSMVDKSSTPLISQPNSKKHVMAAVNSGTTLKKRGIGAKKQQQEDEVAAVVDDDSDNGDAAPAQQNTEEGKEGEEDTKGVDKHIMNKLGILHPTEFRSLITRKLRDTLDPSTAHNEHPSFLCAVLRCAQGFIGTDTKLLFNQVVPYTVACLRHSCVDVVLEALHLFGYLVQKIVNDPAAPKRHTPESQAAVVVLKHAFDTDIFNIAFADTQCVNIRVLALGMAAKSIQMKDQHMMKRKLAVSALLLPLLDPSIATHPTTIFNNGTGGDSEEEGVLEAIQARIAIRKALDYTWKLRKRMHPIEIADGILPALTALTVRLNQASHGAVGTHLPDASPTLGLKLNKEDSSWPTSADSVIKTVRSIPIALTIASKYPTIKSLLPIFGASSTAKDVVEKVEGDMTTLSCPELLPTASVEVAEQKTIVAEDTVVLSRKEEEEKEIAEQEAPKEDSSTDQEEAKAANHEEDADDDDVLLPTQPQSDHSEGEMMDGAALIGDGETPSRGSVRMSSASSEDFVEEQREQEESAAHEDDGPLEGGEDVEVPEEETNNNEGGVDVEDIQSSSEINPPVSPEGEVPTPTVEETPTTPQPPTPPKSPPVEEQQSINEEEEEVMPPSEEALSILHLVQISLQRSTLLLAYPSDAADPYVRKHLESIEQLRLAALSRKDVSTVLQELSCKITEVFGGVTPEGIQRGLESVIVDILANPAAQPPFPAADPYSMEQLWLDAHTMFEGFVDLLKGFSPDSSNHTTTKKEATTKATAEGGEGEKVEEVVEKEEPVDFWSVDPKNGLPTHQHNKPLSPTIIAGISSADSLVDPLVYNRIQQSLRRPINADPTHSQLGAYDEVLIPKVDARTSLPLDAYYFSFHDYDNEWNNAPLFSNAFQLSTSRNADSTSSTVNLRLQPLALKLPSRCGILPAATDPRGSQASSASAAAAAILGGSSSSLGLGSSLTAPSSKSVPYVSPFDTKKGKKMRMKMGIIDEMSKMAEDTPTPNFVAQQPKQQREPAPPVSTPPVSVPPPTSTTPTTHHADPVEVVETAPQPPRRAEPGKAAGAPKRRAKPVGQDTPSAAVTTAPLSHNNRSLSGSFVSVPTQQPVTSTAVEEFEL